MNIDRIDLNLLRVFAAVHAERNVTRAAVRLGITQPAISNAMTRLRRTLDDPLFVRTRQGMEPTALAMRLALPVHQALEMLRNSLEMPEHFDPATARKTLRLLMSDAGEETVLPALLERLESVAPGLAVDSVRAPHAQYAQLMEQGEADLAIGNLRFLPASFYQQRLFKDPYLCICNPQGAFAGRTRIALRQYAQAGHVMVVGGNAEALVEQAFARKRLQRQVRLKVSSYHVALKVVRGTSLLATVPRCFVTPAVHTLELPLPLPAADVRQFWHARMHHDPAHVWFRSLVAEMFTSGRRAA